MLSIGEVFYEGNRVLVERLMPRHLEELKKLGLLDGIDSIFNTYRPGWVQDEENYDFYSNRLQIMSSFKPEIEIEAIVFHRPSNVPLGLMCLSCIDHVNLKAEFSAGFFRGKGSRSALEALFWAIEKIFNEMKIMKLIFYTLPTNSSVLKAFKKLEVKLEARLIKEILLSNNQRSDILRFSIFKEDWHISPFREKLNNMVPLKNI